MVSGGRGVTIRLLVLLGLVVTTISYLLLRIWTAQGGALPLAAWGGLVVLMFMACGVLSAGLPVRRFLRGQSRKPLNPMRAMRTVVLAQAAALTGAVVSGWYVAQILILLPDLDVASRRSLAFRCAALAAGGVLMAVAGMVVQAWCRVDRDPRDPSSDRDSDWDSGRDDDADLGAEE
jgi:hypothetical protein